jgi:3-hydroxyisobutyrate dehydrogenase
MANAVKKTGMIGLGAMGYQMARHMVNKGFAVAGCDVLEEARARAKAAGINVVATPADVGAGAEVAVPLAALVDQLMKGMNQEKMKALLV